MKLELTIPGLPSCNSAAAPGWRARHAERQLWKSKVMGAVLMDLGRRPKPMAKAHVTLTRCSTTEPDADNLAGSFKFVLDGLVLACVIEDDSPQCIVKFESRWEKAKRGEGRVRIVVESVGDVEIGERMGAREG